MSYGGAEKILPILAHLVTGPPRSIVAKTTETAIASKVRAGKGRACGVPSGLANLGVAMTYRRLGLSVSVLCAALAAIVVQSIGGLADINPQPVDNTRNALNAPAPDSAAQFGSAPKVKTGVAFCTSAPTGDANVNTDCQQSTVGPHNETSIAVDPTNPLHMVGGANDYQLSLNPDGHVAETILSQAHVTFDGGKSWANYPVFSDASYQATGDPAIAFDAQGTVYYSTLGFRFVSKANATNPDVLVSHSNDGGKSWTVVRVASGSGVATSVGDLLDKEYIAAWGNGNVIVTYGDFVLGQKGNTIGSDTFAQVSHDGGDTWGDRQLLSGGLNHQAFVATPVVAKNGNIFVSFLNTTDLASGRDDYEVDQVDPTTGAVIFGPVKVATTVDGFKDSPFAFGRETYQDSVFRSWAAGNIAADPKDSNHLAVVWSDWRDSPPPDPSLNPYKSITDADIIVSESTDGGHTWSAAAAIRRAGDQFQPWTVFDSNGQLRIGFFDRFYDQANHKYGFTVATKTTAGFTFQQVTTTLSDPTKGDRWFARTVSAGFPHATAFLGDYSGIAATAGGGVVAYWCDMRNTVDFAGRSGTGEDAYFGRAS